MANMENARRAKAGAVVSRLDGQDPQHSSSGRKIQQKPDADECILLLGHAFSMGRIDANNWAFSFVRSIVRQSERPGWVPSPRQLSSMRALVEGLAEPDDGLLIDEGDRPPLAMRDGRAP